MQNLISKIARKHLGLEALEAQNSDSLDFKELSVWEIEAALKAAFQAGQQSAEGGATCEAMAGMIQHRIAKS